MHCLNPLDCACNERYTIIWDNDSDKWYGLDHGRMVTGPMDKHDAEQWLDAVRGDEK